MYALSNTFACLFLDVVALSYSLQIMEEGATRVTPYDVSLDALVSPAGFTPISAAALEGSEWIKQFLIHFVSWNFSPHVYQKLISY